MFLSPSRGRSLAVLLLLAPVLAACATPAAMTVAPAAIGNVNPKYRNAVVVRSVSGGQAMNVMTVPGVPNEPFKAALESSLDGAGYLAKGGGARYQIDAEIKNLDQPLIGLEFEVVANVTYKVSGGGTVSQYPIVAKGKATFSDSPIGADRIRIANERAMQENIKQFFQALK
jgi:hypothetical protein